MGDKTDTEQLIEDLRDQATLQVDGPMMSAVRDRLEWKAADKLERLLNQDRLFDALHEAATAVNHENDHLFKELVTVLTAIDKAANDIVEAASPGKPIPFGAFAVLGKEARAVLSKVEANRA